MILVLDVADVNWNRPPGLGQDCMDFDTYMNQCSGGGTSSCGTDPATEGPCIAAMAAQVNACQAAWTSVPGNCHEAGTNVSYSQGTVTETTPSGQTATANANTAPATAYGNGISQTGAPLSSYADSGFSPVIYQSSPAPAPAPTAPAASPAPSSVVVSSGAPPASSSSTTSSGSTAASNSDVMIGGFDLSTVPWYVWAGGAAVVAFMLFGKK